VEGIRLYASHAIPFRRLGNIVQDIQTTTEGSISIQCDAQARNSGHSRDDVNRAIAFVQDELNRLKDIYANPANFITLRISNLSQQHSQTDLTSQVTLEFAFTIDLANAPSVGSDISLRTA
jgi:hypothetical protein